MMPRGYVARVGRFFRSALPRAYLIGRPASAVVYGAARLSVCRVVLQIPRARHTRQICCGQVASILVASSADTSDTLDFLVTC